MGTNDAIFSRIQMQHHSIKNLLQWGEHLSVEHAEIDAQHKELFEIGITFFESWKDGVSVDSLRTEINKLTALLNAHFTYEENILAEIGYKDIKNHVDEHKAMLKELATIAERFKVTDKKGKAASGSILAPGWPITQLLLGFIVGHVSTSDMSYCRSIAESRRTS